MICPITSPLENNEAASCAEGECGLWSPTMKMCSFRGIPVVLGQILGELRVIRSDINTHRLGRHFADTLPKEKS